MVSDSDTLVLRSVPVHPSSRSPTDEHWKQIWGNQALFCCLTDLSESSLACVSLYLPPPPNWHLQSSVSPAGNLGLSSLSSRPSHLFIIRSSFSPLLLLPYVHFIIDLKCFSCSDDVWCVCRWVVEHKGYQSLSLSVCKHRSWCHSWSAFAPRTAVASSNLDEFPHLAIHKSSAEWNVGVGGGVGGGGVEEQEEEEE